MTQERFTRRELLKAVQDARERFDFAGQTIIDKLKDRVEGLESDLDNAIEAAFKRGAIEWTRLNHPDHYARLATVPLTYPVEYDVLPIMSELQDKVEPTDCYMLGSAMLEIYELRRALSKKEDSE